MRNPVFDIMKGVTILLMMLGHTGIPEWLHTFIYSFHMPLFFIVSGYFAKKDVELTWRGWGSIIRKSSKTLLLPYVVTAIVVLLFTLMRAVVKHDISIFGDRLVACFACTSGVWHFPENWTFVSPIVNLSWAPIWFLLSLFWIRILFYGLQKLDKWTLPVCAIISYVAVLIGQRVTVPFAIMQGLSGLVFYAAGWTAKHFNIPKYVYTLCLIAWPFAIVFGDVNMMFMRYTLYPLSIIGAIGGTVAVYELSCAVNKTPYLNHVFSWLGCNSLLILCFHSIDMNCVWVGMILNGALHLEAGELVLTLIRNAMVFVFAVVLSRVPVVRRIFNVK